MKIESRIHTASLDTKKNLVVTKEFTPLETSGLSGEQEEDILMVINQINIFNHKAKLQAKRELIEEKTLEIKLTLKYLIS